MALLSAVPVRSPTSPLHYQPGINNLRAIAALGVCLFHYFTGLLPEREHVAFTKHLFVRGYLGIDIFFVISGFIIPYSLLRQNYQLTDFGTYLKHRLIRINPPAYAAMLLVLAQWTFIDTFAKSDHAYLGSVSVPRLLHNFLFTIPFTRYEWLVGACWTLATELQFYLFLGLLFSLLFAPQRSVWWFVGGYLLLSIGYQANVATTITFLTNAPLFALGGTCVLWQQQRLSALGFGALLFVFTALTYWQLDWMAAAVGLLTAGAILTVRTAVPGLSAIGKISYSLYLTHMLVGRMTEFLLIRIIAPTSDIRRTLIVCLCLGAALGVAALFYLWVERPFVQLAKRVR
ncbi:MAG: acyltransferase family protein [Janthinobacterium lividum]